MAAPPAVARSASPSPPPLDYLRDELATAFFNAREHEAYYRSLRTSVRPRPIDARRAYYDTFRPVLLRLLALADDDGIVFLEHLITANIREEKRTLGAKARGSPAERVRRVEPRGMKILGDDAGRDFEHLRTAYRAAALRCHPDLGGSHEDMKAVNGAFEMLHRLLVETAGAEPIVGEGDDSREMPGDTTNALAYLWTVRQLLLGIALDDWALEEASDYLDALIPVRAPRAAKPEGPELPFLIYDPQSERIIRTSDLMEQACRLTWRLCAAGRSDGATRSLAIARELHRAIRDNAARHECGGGDYDPAARRDELIRVVREMAYGRNEDGSYKVESPRSREHFIESLEAIERNKQLDATFVHPSLRKAEEYVAGKRKPWIGFETVRQVENAFRLGVIDEKRYRKDLSRLAEKEARLEADRRERLAILARTRFAPLLPSDAQLKPSRNCGRMVPYPKSNDYSLEDLTADQHAEYLRAFRDADDLDLAARYAPFRLGSVFQSAIRFPDRCNLASLAEEADALVQIQPECHICDRASANIIWLIAELDGSRRAEFVSELAKPLRRGLWPLDAPVWKLADKFAATTASANKFYERQHDLLVAVAAYEREHPRCFGSDSVAKSASALAAYEREHPSTRLVGKEAQRQGEIERQRQAPLPDLPAALRDQLRDSHNALIAAVEECFGPDSPLIQELGGKAK